MTTKRSAYARLQAIARTILRPLAVYLARLRLWSKAISELDFVASSSGRNSLRRSILFAPISALRRLGEFQNLVLLEDATIHVRGIGQFHVRAHTDDLYVVLPSSEKSVLDFIRTYLTPGDAFVDAGANIGIYTVAASKIVGDSGSVVAIEMMPETFERLRGHVELNDCSNVTLVNRAVHSEAGRFVAATLPAKGRHGKASIIIGAAGSEDRTITVETDTLDNILRPFPRIRLMKMDLEGAETMAIRGAGEALDRIEAIIFERWDADHDATGELQKWGFRVRQLDSRNCVAERVARAGDM